MSAVNVFVLEGRIAIKEDKVKLRESYPGDAYASCSFRFAVDRYKKSDGTSTSDFVTCVAFGLFRYPLPCWPLWILLSAARQPLTWTQEKIWQVPSISPVS